MQICKSSIMMKCSVVLHVFLVLFCSSAWGSKVETLSVLRKGPWQYEMVSGPSEGAVLSSTLTNNSNETGWYQLQVQALPSLTDHEAAYLAGYSEGFVTAELINQHYVNSFGNKPYCGQPSEYCNKLDNFLEENQKYMSQEITANPLSPFWYQVELYMTQLKGLEEGYGNSTMPPLPKNSMWLLQLAADLDALESALKAREDERRSFSHIYTVGAERKVIGAGKCSALVKLVPPNNHELYTSHDTWSEYQDMLRVMKLYDLPYHMTSKSPVVVHGDRIAMSSYPGKLQSEDDYYLCSSGLVTMETTNGNSNPDLWKYVNPQTVFEPVRTMVANRIAFGGKEWTDIFSLKNSGTYNNQWMVVDYKLFVPGNKLPSYGLLWVLEQIPGKVVAEDQTAVLASKSYWASYNIPYYESIFNASGFPDMVKQYGDWFTHEGAPRAKIFARDHNSVTDMKSMIKLMRYNDFKHDPLSRCKCNPPYSAENAISARSDLNPANGTYPFGALGHRCHGGIDNKVTSSSLMSTLSCIATCGPTHQQQPVFQWSTSGFGSTPLGHPDKFDFKPVQIDWSNSKIY